MGVGFLANFHSFYSKTKYILSFMTVHKKILITGASDGIGFATALELARHQHTLILTARRKEKLELLRGKIQQEFPQTEVHCLAFDIRDFEACKRAITSLPMDLQHLDVLINNAGLALGNALFHEGEIEDWEQVIDTNVKGVIYLTRLLSPAMVAQKSGHIINLGSIASHEIYPGGNIYCASKHAVRGLTRAMRADFLPYNIRVSQISPGATETSFSNVRYRGDKERVAAVYAGYEPLRAEDVARVIDFVIHQPAHVCLNEVILTATAQFEGAINRELSER